jgi:hypothetical protein
MQRILTKLLVAVFVASVAMYAADSSLGTWKLNLAKSTSQNTNPIKSRTDVYEAIPNGSVKVTRIEVRTDGTTYDYSYTCKYDGKEYSVKGAMYKTISTRRADANTIIEIKKGGLFNQTVKNVYSEDGKTRTSIMKGTDAQGKPVSATLIFDKQ